MSRSRRLLLPLCVALLSAGCGDNGSSAPDGPTFAVTRLELAADQASATVAFDPGGANVAWSITTSDPWLTVQPASGTGPATLTVTVDRSELAPGTLTASLQVESSLGNPLLPVTVVVASAAGAALTVSPASLDFGESSSTATFQIDNTGPGTLVWSAAELVSWATVSPRQGSGPGAVTVTVNRTGLPAGAHQGFVRVTSNGGQATLPLRLVVPGAGGGAAALLTVSPNVLAFGAENQQTLALSAGSGVSWSLAPTAPWLAVSPTEGSGSATLTVTLDRAQLVTGLNSTALGLTYTAEGQSAQLAVPVSVFVGSATAPAQLAISPAALTFSGQSTSGTLAVANLGPGALTWTVTSSAPWLQVSPGAGSGDGTVEVSFDPDHPALTDAATLQFTSNGGTASLPVTVHLLGGGQSGVLPSLDVVPSFLDFGNTSTERNLQVNNAGGGQLAWSAGTLQDWISLFPAAGTDDTVVRVVIDRAALPGASNLGSITFTSDFGNRTVLVSATKESGQGNPQLLINPTGLDFGSVTTQRTFAVANAGGGTLTWIATPTQPWLTATPNTGTGGATVTVRVNRAGLAAGPYSGAVAVTSNGGSANVAVEMTVP